MRVLTAAFCLALLASAPAEAGDWSPDNDRILGDPAYLPLRGQLFGAFSATYGVDSYQFEDPTFFGPVTDSYHRQRTDFLPSLSYGITDTISVSANLDFGSARSSETFVQTRFDFAPLQAGVKPVSVQALGTGGLNQALGNAISGDPVPSLPGIVRVQRAINRRSIGAEDPAFAITWRAIGQDRAAVNLDLSAAYAPDIFQARGASPLMTGSRASGGQRGTAQAAVSREMQRLTIRAYGTFGYDGREDSRGAGEVTRAGAHPTYAAGVQTEIRLLPFLALNTGGSISRAARFDAVDISTFNGTTYLLSTTTRPATDIEPYAGIVFPIFGRRAVGELLYEHDFVSDEKLSLPQGEGRYANQQSNLFTASIRFVLG